MKLLDTACLLLTAIALAGCGGAADSADFSKAPPEIKAAWERAVAADKTNGYVTASFEYKSILQYRDSLSPAQAQAVQEASGKLFQRLVEASTKGDPAAREALNALGNLDRARGTPR